MGESPTSRTPSTLRQSVFRHALKKEKIQVLDHDSINFQDPLLGWLSLAHKGCFAYSTPPVLPPYLTGEMQDHLAAVKQNGLA